MSKNKKVFAKLYNFQLSFPIGDNFSIEDYATKIKALSYVKDYAIIIHDKDVDSNGNPVGKHIHVVCYPDNTYTVRKYATDFNVPEESIRKNKNRFKRSLIYLMKFNEHLESTYDFSEIIHSGTIKKHELIQYIVKHNIYLREVSEVFNYE